MLRYAVVECENAADIEARLNGDDFPDYKVVQLTFNPMDKDHPWVLLLERRP